MTDDDLNRLVAERVMGFDVRWNVRGSWWQIGHDDTTRLPAYCTDPAAWGALLVWLAKENRGPVLTANYPEVTDWRAEVWSEDDNNRHEVTDTLPGRALVRATLRAWGVEVPE